MSFAMPRRAVFGAWRGLVIGVLGALLAACSGVKFVADYDAEAARGIADTSAAVFAFYDRMISARAAPPRPAALSYRDFADDWGRTETQIRVMLVREASRPLNADSEAIAKTILDFWVKYRAAHLNGDDYNARLLGIHRDRFQRLFAAALRAEKAKQLNAADSNPAAPDSEP
ncbi:MAG: hypothetical protein ABL900_04320 [Burkholderiaceae bacterium]